MCEAIPGYWKKVGRHREALCNRTLLGWFKFTVLNVHDMDESAQASTLAGASPGDGLVFEKSNFNVLIETLSLKRLLQIDFGASFYFKKRTQVGLFLDEIDLIFTSTSIRHFDVVSLG